MPTRSDLLDTLARRVAAGSLATASKPAYFATANGERAEGHAVVSVSRSSIAIRFTTAATLTVARRVDGGADGRVGTLDGTWLAPGVNDFGATGGGQRLFGAQELVVNYRPGCECEATRLVFAGAAWQGTALLAGRRVIVAPLSTEIVSHHDALVSIAIEGKLDDRTIEAIDRASSFVAGLDLQLLTVESFFAQGDLIQAKHLRGFRRLGRGPHSPFAGIADEHLMRAWAALVTAIPRLEKEGVPIITMINHITAHSHVAEINASAALLLLVTQTAAYHHTHGREVGEGAASRRQEMMRLNRDLHLGLGEADLDRFEKLRVELLEAGFFHKPGYETGRPQKDIKFLRDIAHMTVFRLCGYSGPFYGAESFAVRETPEIAR